MEKSVRFHYLLNSLGTKSLHELYNMDDEWLKDLGFGEKTLAELRNCYNEPEKLQDKKEWILVDYPHGQYRFGIYETGKESKIVATIGPFYEDEKDYLNTMEQRGHLLSAAPEMLAALQAAYCFIATETAEDNTQVIKLIQTALNKVFNK